MIKKINKYYIEYTTSGDQQQPSLIVEEEHTGGIFICKQLFTTGIADTGQIIFGGTGTINKSWNDFKTNIPSRFAITKENHKTTTQYGFGDNHTVRVIRDCVNQSDDPTQPNWSCVVGEFNK